MTETQPATTAADDRRPPLPPVGHGLGAQDLQAVAQRLEWPEGALPACQAIAEDYPGWSAWHVVMDSPSYGAAGYRATCEHIKYPDRPPYGETAEALRTQITKYLDGAHGPARRAELASALDEPPSADARGVGAPAPDSPSRAGAPPIPYQSRSRSGGLPRRGPKAITPEEDTTK